MTVTESEQSPSGWGVYGLHIDVPPEFIDQSLVVEVRQNWPRWSIVWERPVPGLTDGDPLVETWSADHAVLAAQPVGTVTLDRARARTTLALPEPPAPEALLHPFLASTGVVANHWFGRAPFHAGAFAFHGRSWGVLGAREMGKSSLLMSLHQAGLPILSDDVLVIDGTTAFSGPRCLDLRLSAAERFEEGSYLGVVGTRERWRVTLPSVPPDLPFGGWVLLDWSDAIEIGYPSATERLQALIANSGLTVPGVVTAGLLELARTPMLRFGRPLDWTAADEALGSLLAALEVVEARTVL